VKSLRAKNVYGIRRIQSGLLVLFTLLVLLIFNGSAWWIYLKVGRYLDDIFSRSLQESAELAAQALGQDPDVGRMPPGPNSLEYIERQSQLIALQQSGNFNDLFLIDPSYRNLAGVYPDFRPGAVDGLLALDRAWLEQARAGQTALTPVTHTGGLFLKTAYVPIRSTDGSVEALLVAKADVEFLKPKIAIRNTLAVITALNGLVVILLALAYAGFLRSLQRAEAGIVHGERLASLGQMAAGIAHELRNPLNIIEQTMTLLRRRYDKEQDPLFEYVPGEVTRMNDIITQFLDLSREAPVEKAPGNLAEVLDRTLALLEYRIRKNQVRLEKQYPERIPLTMDAGKMQQVFLNLCINALEAMPEREGVLRVEAKEGPGRGGWSITVEDNGAGIPREVRERIFEPFYTSKPAGTGLGLWVVEQLLALHGGRVEVDSEPGRGTRMIVSLSRETSAHRMGTGPEG
jgi:signal transduction histidine kinase